MESLIASYGESSSDSEIDSPPRTIYSNPNSVQVSESNHLPPPPIDLLNPPNSIDGLPTGTETRVRSFPHVQGNYAVHVFIPVMEGQHVKFPVLSKMSRDFLSIPITTVTSESTFSSGRKVKSDDRSSLSPNTVEALLCTSNWLCADLCLKKVHLPPTRRKELAQLLKRIMVAHPDLYVVDVDIPLNMLCKDDQKFEQVALAREFHISLGRTVPIRVHQIESITTMLRQRLQSQKQFWIDFNKLQVFVNDDRTRTFLSLEVLSRGLAEITKQIQTVNEIYRLHNLPEFYKDPRPHISIAWGTGDTSQVLERKVEEEMRRQKLNFACKFGGIECKIGSKVYKICKVLDE